MAKTKPSSKPAQTTTQKKPYVPADYFTPEDWALDSSESAVRWLELVIEAGPDTVHGSQVLLHEIPHLREKRITRFLPGIKGLIKKRAALNRQLYDLFLKAAPLIQAKHKKNCDAVGIGTTKDEYRRFFAQRIRQYQKIHESK